MVDRTLNEVVNPLRKLELKEEEIVALKAIIVLNPRKSIKLMIIGNVKCIYSTESRDLSKESSAIIANARDRVQDILFQVIRETHHHPKELSSARFGNLLLILPSIAVR